MPRFDGSFKSVSQLVDDILNSANEIETKISEAAENFKRAINVTNGSKGSPNHPVTNRNTVGTVTKGIDSASTNDMSGVLVADGLKENMYPKVGIYYCCIFYG